MAWPTMEQEASAAKHEIDELKQRLTKREDDIHNMEMDLNFHVLKAQELQDVLDSSASNTLRSKLEVKALQNTELTLQVQELRYQLEGSNHRASEFEAEAKRSSERIRKLNEGKKSNQKLLVEMSDVVRTLGQIEIDYAKEDETPTNSSAPLASLDNIKRKIRAIEDDRQKYISANQKLQTEVFEKELEIKGLLEEANQFGSSSVSEGHVPLLAENKKLLLDCETKDHEISHLRNMVSNLENPQSSVPANVTCIPTLDDGQSVEDPALEVQLQSDGSMMILESSSSKLLQENEEVSKHSRSATRHSKELADSSSFSSLESPDHHSTISGANVSKDQQELIKRYEGLQHALGRSRAKLQASKKKQDVREKLLREVISQYKDLQVAHDESERRCVELQDMLHSQDCERKSKASKNPKALLNEPYSPTTSVGPIEESSTFDTAEVSSGTSRSDTEISPHDASNVQVKDSLTMDLERHCSRLQRQCRRLEHEYAEAIGRVTHLEEDLAVATAKIESLKGKNKKKEAKINDLKLVKQKLENDFKSSHQESNQLRQELDLALKQGRESRVLQQQREQDLWDVIDQYKHLQAENNTTKEKMSGVESELGKTQAQMETVAYELSIAKRHTQRRDLVCQFRKLEQELELKTQDMKNLQELLRVSKATAAKNKEETKCTRKRLAGSHFHFKQLQVQYDDLVSQKVESERQLSKASRQLKIFEKQRDTWTQKLNHVRQERQGTEKARRKLAEENRSLKSHCNELLQLASKSIDAL